VIWGTRTPSRKGGKGRSLQGPRYEARLRVEKDAEICEMRARSLGEYLQQVVAS